VATVDFTAEEPMLDIAERVEPPIELMALLVALEPIDDPIVDFDFESTKVLFNGF